MTLRERIEAARAEQAALSPEEWDKRELSFDAKVRSFHERFAAKESTS